MGEELFEGETETLLWPSLIWWQLLTLWFLLSFPCMLWWTPPSVFLWINLLATIINSKFCRISIPCDCALSHSNRSTSFKRFAYFYGYFSMHFGCEEWTERRKKSNCCYFSFTTVVKVNLQREVMKLKSLLNSPVVWGVLFFFCLPQHSIYEPTIIHFRLQYKFC